MKKYWFILFSSLLVTLTANADVKMFVKGSFPLTCGGYFTFSSPSQTQVEIPAGKPTELITPNFDGSFTTAAKVGTPLEVVGSPGVCAPDCKYDITCMQYVCEPSVGATGKVTESGTITVTCR